MLAIFTSLSKATTLFTDTTLLELRPLLFLATMTTARYGHTHLVTTPTNHAFLNEGVELQVLSDRFSFNFHVYKVGGRSTHLHSVPVRAVSCGVLWYDRGDHEPVAVSWSFSLSFNISRLCSCCFVTKCSRFR